MAYFRKAHSQNVVYAEVFFDPQAHTVARDRRSRPSIEGIRRAQARRRGSRSDCARQLIMCFLRDLSAESALDDARGSRCRTRTGSSASASTPTSAATRRVKFKDVFARARGEGFRLTMHCDVDQEDSVEHIWQCLDEIGVERIDHGVNSLEDARSCSRRSRAAASG